MRTSSSSRSAICSLIMACLFATAFPVLAQETSLTPAARFFRDAAMIDVEAAWSLLEHNHPGAAPSMRDDQFRQMLDKAHTVSRERATHVDTAEGYLAVMSGFSNMLDDKHLSFKPTLVVAKVDWVGLLIALRERRWIVVDESTWPGRAPLEGAELVECNGTPVDELARSRLGSFRADWSIEAQRGLAAPWLLIDERNPFLPRLTECTFKTGSGSRVVAMEWQPISRDLIIQRVNKAAGIGAAGFDVRRVGKGWWIAMGELTANGPAVVAAAQAHQAELRAAPFIVFDVRGNGGGASDLGDQIARILYGADALPDASSNVCPTPWRVSLDNKARLESYPKLLGDRLSPDASAAIAADIAGMNTAFETGREFSRPLRPCHKPKQIVAHASPRVFILTDRVCFSSCLILVDTFRKLGAIQIGEATNANTRYQENRSQPLPSGLGTFAVQATVDLTRPPRVGPFLPSLAYGGDLTNTREVEAWIISSVIPQSSSE
ncbi:MAG: hypothetical protein EON58_08355 [Alphaproteobacteria bacterium]|nr:MAG: hypothetical protein EON58_08355 [Alphaproteobacteria bacterium]